MSTDPLQHYARYKETYQTIDKTLDTLRETFLSAETNMQKSMLFDSSVFAVMSVQNDVSILRDAFRTYANLSDEQDIDVAFQTLNYGNNKLSYAKHNKEVIESSVGNKIILRLQVGEVWDAVDLMQEHLHGVSWVKAPFVAAMLGFKDVMCIDTNVAQMVPDDSVKAKDYSNKESYQEAVESVLSEFPDISDLLSPFMVQWIVFDTNRNAGVAKHEEWFEVMLPSSPFGRQTMIGSF